MGGKALWQSVRPTIPGVCSKYPEYRPGDGWRDSWAAESEDSVNQRTKVGPAFFTVRKTLDFNGCNAQLVDESGNPAINQKLTIEYQARMFDESACDEMFDGLDDELNEVARLRLADMLRELSLFQIMKQASSKG
jgi:hypothetical protein